MPVNYYWFFIAGLIPLVIGAVYYHPKVLGKAWMQTNGFSEKDLAGANMMVIFLLAYLLGCMLAFALSPLVIHQTGTFAMMMPGVLESGSEVQQDFNAMMMKYGDAYRSFGHGALHGFIASLFIAWPIIAINSMFERRGWKYTAIHLGYWVITLTLIGGIICQTLVYPSLG